MTKNDAKLIPLASLGLAVGMFNEFIRPNPGVTMWSFLGGAVLAYELLCPAGDTLSEVVDRGIVKHPVLTIGAIGVTAAHLANILPGRFDPYHKLFETIRPPYSVARR